VKPTFQWIETAPMGVCGAGRLTPTPATVRAETWLAIAGGARGIGFFPGEWTPPIGAEIARLTRELKAVAPALVTAAPAAASAPAPLRVAAWTLNGAAYVVVANPTRRAVRTTIHVGGLGGRTLRPAGGGSALAATGDTVTTTFGPLAADVYVAAP
jgi:hypothetical protein